jgi:hypothetical protein
MFITENHAEDSDNRPVSIHCSKQELESLMTAIAHCKNTYPYNDRISANEQMGHKEAADSWRKARNTIIKLSYDITDHMWKEHEKAFNARED